MIIPDCDLLQLLDTIRHGAHNLIAGGVAIRVQNAAMAVRPFPRQAIAPFSSSKEAPIRYQLLDARPDLRGQAHRPLRVAQACPGNQCILTMVGRGIIVCEHQPQSRLRIACITIEQRLLRYDQHPLFPACLDSV